MGLGISKLAHQLTLVYQEIPRNAIKQSEKRGTLNICREVLITFGGFGNFHFKFYYGNNNQRDFSSGCKDRRVSHLSIAYVFAIGPKGSQKWAHPSDSGGLE